MPYRHPSLRILVVIAIVLNAIIVLTTAIGISRHHSHHLSEAEIRSQSIASAIDMAVSEEIRKIDLSLNTVIAEIAKSPSLGKTARDSIHRLIRQQMASLPETEAWSITDDDGRIIFHSSLSGAATFSVGDRTYFQELKSEKSDRLILSKPLQSRLTRDRIVILAKSYAKADGSFGGVVAIPLSLGFFNRILSHYEVGTKGTAGLRYRDGESLTRVLRKNNRSEATEFGTADDSRLTTLMTAGEATGTFQTRSSFDGIDRVVCFRRMSHPDLYVLVSVSSHDFLAEWESFSKKIIVCVGLFLLIGNGLLLLLYRVWKRQQDHAAKLSDSLACLRESDRALLAAEQAGELGTFTIDLRDRTWGASERLFQIFGADHDFPRTLEAFVSLVYAQDRALIRKHYYIDVLGEHRKLDCEYRIVHQKSGELVWVHCLGVLEFDPDGNVRSLSGTIKDVTARKRVQERLILTQEVFQSAHEGILVTDKDGTIIETNPAFSIITGYSNEEVKGKNPKILQSGKHDAEFYKALWSSLTRDACWEGQFINRRKDGHQYIQHSKIFSLRDAQGNISRYCAVISDVTALDESQRRLEYIAYHDELTGVANRTLLADRMQNAMALCRRRDSELLAVCHIDIDAFKEINDQWGHDVGNALLIELAHRLSSTIRAGDTIGRMGGDEFVVVLAGMQTEESVKTGISRLIRESTAPFAKGSEIIEFSLSTGVTIYPLDKVEEPEVLIRHADQAMYEAKRGGKNNIRFFDPGTEQRLRHHQEIHDQLADAVTRDELCLHYQPKVDLKTGEISGFEALVRWNKPGQGLVFPGDFLPAIEATELTLAVGEWILHRALGDLLKWRAAGFDSSVSVNIFGRHLQRTDFVDRLGVILAAYPELQPGKLELEIVETTAIEDMQRVSKCIAGCAKYGVRFALDDFGTGFSSLTYLRQLPAETVKIDRSFVKDLLDNEQDHALVQGIIGMAHAMGREVVAEGVETLEHGCALLRYGCNYVQGYGIARPMPAESVVDWAASWKMPALWSEERLSNVIHFYGSNNTHSRTPSGGTD